MGSIFGGAQSIPTNQFTNQNVTQDATQTTAANAYAQNVGTNLQNTLLGFGGLNNLGALSQLPQLQTLPYTSYEQAATDRPVDFANRFGNYALSMSPDLITLGGGYQQAGANIAQQAPDYVKYGTNLMQYAPQLFNQGAGLAAQVPGIVNQGLGYFSQGANLAAQSGAPITAGDVAGFYNPFAANVTANLQDIFGQQNLANRIGATAASGGVGADRAAVGQALLAQKQGLTAGSVYADLYQRALQAAEQQKQQQLAASQGIYGAGQGYLGAGQGYLGAAQSLYNAGQGYLGAGQGVVGAGGTLAGIGQGVAGIGSQLGQLGLQTGQLSLGADQAALQAAAYQAARLQDPMKALYQYQMGQYQQPLLTSQYMTQAMPSLIGLGQTGTQTTTGQQQGIGTGTTTYPAPSVLSQVAGLGTLGAGLYGLLSDPRAKTDIQKAGYDPTSKLPMYAFRYKGDPKTYPKVVGPMTTDVEKKYPGAVRHLAAHASGGSVLDFHKNKRGHYQYAGSVGANDGIEQYQDQNDDQGQDQQQDQPDLDSRAQQAQQQLARQKKYQQFAKSLQQLQAYQQSFRNLASQKTPGVQFPVTPWALGRLPMPQPLGGVFGRSRRGGRVYQEGGSVPAPNFGLSWPNNAGNWPSTAGASSDAPSMGAYDQPLNYQNLYAAARSPFLGPISGKPPSPFGAIPGVNSTPPTSSVNNVPPPTPLPTAPQSPPAPLSSTTPPTDPATAAAGNQNGGGGGPPAWSGGPANRTAPPPGWANRPSWAGATSGLPGWGQGQQEGGRVDSATAPDWQGMGFSMQEDFQKASDAASQQGLDLGKMSPNEIGNLSEGVGARFQSPSAYDLPSYGGDAFGNYMRQASNEGTPYTDAFRNAVSMDPANAWKYSNALNSPGGAPSAPAAATPAPAGPDWQGMGFGSQGQYFNARNYYNNMYGPAYAANNPFDTLTPAEKAFYSAQVNIPPSHVIPLTTVNRRQAGGRIRRYQDGGDVEAEPAGLPELLDDLESDDEHEPAGRPTQESIPLPTPRPTGEIPSEEAGRGSPFAPGGGRGGFRGPAGVLGGGNRVGSANPYMALMQAGLGMLAASGQRDRHGLPMSPLGAIGAGGALGLESYQKGLAQDQAVALRQQQLDSLERHRRALEGAAQQRIALTRQLAGGRTARPFKMTDPNTLEEYLVTPEGKRIPIEVQERTASSKAGAPAASAAETQATTEPFTPDDQKPDEEYLKTLPEETQGVLKKMAAGEVAPPSGSNRSRQAQLLLRQLFRAYPNADLTLWKTRNETRSAFAKGVEGRGVTALYQLSGHLNDLKETSEALAQHKVRKFDQIENAVKDQLGGTALADYQTARAAVADELARVFQGAGVAAESEKERWLSNLDSSRSPEQFQRVMGRLTSLVESRMRALEEQHDRGMNYSPEHPKSRVRKGFLEGEAKERFEKVKQWGQGRKPAVPLAPQEGEKALPTISSKAEYEKLPSGQFMMNGKIYWKP